MLVHSYYDDRSPSGENVVVDAQADALRRAGYDVRMAVVRTRDAVEDPFFELRAAARVATGRGRRPDIGDADVVHAHNLFPNFGRRWAREADLPIVATLHNYRPVCAQPMLIRDGDVCTLCPEGHRWSSFRYACYRDSRLRTLPLTVSLFGGPMTDPLLAAASRILVMNQRMADVYRDAGVPSARLIVAPNFLSDADDPGAPPPLGDSLDSWLFVGRLGREKGIRRLVEAWPDTHRLQVVGGGGDDAAAVQALARPSVELLGPRSRSEVLARMQASLGLVFPSTWFEGSPLVYAEALACGLPVLAFEPTALAWTVEEDGTGARTDWTSDLESVLEDAAGHFPTLRARCRAVFESTYSESAFVARTSRIYRDVLKGG